MYLYANAHTPTLYGTWALFLVEQNHLRAGEKFKVESKSSLNAEENECCIY